MYIIETEWGSRLKIKIVHAIYWAPRYGLSWAAEHAELKQLYLLKERYLIKCIARYSKSQENINYWKRPKGFLFMSLVIWNASSETLVKSQVQKWLSANLIGINVA